MAKHKAEWTVSLHANCPECNHLLDLTDENDFWEYSGITQAGETGTPASTDYECMCPECEHEFTVDFVY